MYKVGFGSARVAAASFMTLSDPAMAVECDHTGEPGVIECGKKNNVFLSEDRFLDNTPSFFIPLVPVFATDFDELGCWEWSWVFERWEWDDDCD